MHSVLVRTLALPVLVGFGAVIGSKCLLTNVPEDLGVLPGSKFVIEARGEHFRAVVGPDVPLELPPVYMELY